MGPTKPPPADILLVEDDDGLGAILAAVLEDQGYSVDRVLNGREALNHLHPERPPRIILLNLVMPAMNGWKFRKQLKKFPELAEIPIVVISGVSRLEKKAASMGASESFLKPFNLKALVDTVHDYYQRGEQASPTKISATTEKQPERPQRAMG
jgi:DNA-binding response OmpR family regulator